MNRSSFRRIAALAMTVLATTLLLAAIPPTPVYAIQSATGFQSWEKVKEIQFTFVVNRSDKEITRSWTWQPGSNVVTWRGGAPIGTLTAPYSYDRDLLPAPLPADAAPADGATPPAEPPEREVDARFINDSFWLLLPLHLGWSKEVVLTETGQTPRPLSGAAARTIHVQYPAAGGGYSPGDAYDLWLDEQDRIVEWSYYPGGATPAAMSTTWDGYQTFGPLLLSTERKGADGAVKLGFRDIVVVTK